MARVSVVIPTYNRSSLIKQTIQSVLAQTFNDFEVIVVDDGSTDNTMEVISSFKDPRIRYIYKENGGVSLARNTGIKASGGEYIAFLDSDDIWLPENLEFKVKLLDSRPDVGLVCSDSYVFDNSTGATLGRLWHDPHGPHSRFDPVRAARQPLKEFLYNGCFIMPPAAVIRSQVFTAVGYFDESLPTYEDWDLVIHILQRFPIEIIDIPLLKIRQHDTKLTGNQEKMYRGAVAAINKAIRSGSFSGVDLKLLKERLVRAYFRYGRWSLICDKKAAARKALISGIRLAPWNFKLYVYFSLSTMGACGTLAVKSYKKLGGSHLFQSHSSGGAGDDSSKLFSK